MKSQNKILHISLASVLALVFTACNGNYPVIEDSVGADREWFVGEYRGGNGILSSTSHRSKIVTKLADSTFCSEPEPTTASNLKSLFYTALSATTKDVNATVDVVRSISKMADQLFSSSQGLRFSQVQHYNLCQAFRNGDLNTSAKATRFKVMFNDIMQNSKEIILAETNASVLHNKWELEALQKGNKTLQETKKELDIKVKSLSKDNNALIQKNFDLNVSNLVLSNKLKLVTKCSVDKNVTQD